MLTASYTLTATTTLVHEEAVDRVRQELQQEGFGVLCEINVAANLNEKLGVDHEPYLILGACMPQLAHSALTLEPNLGALLPCNVAVYRHNGETHISAIDPEQMLSIVDNDDLEQIAGDVRQRLVNVVERAAVRRPLQAHVSVCG
jgi:uncharacterized protein (DUF302 family)